MIGLAGTWTSRLLTTAMMVAVLLCPCFVMAVTAPAPAHHAQLKSSTADEHACCRPPAPEAAPPATPADKTCTHCSTDKTVVQASSDHLIHTLHLCQIQPVMLLAPWLQESPAAVPEDLAIVPYRPPKRSALCVFLI